MSNRIAQPSAIVDAWNLNDDPFYQEWRAGTLPVHGLAEYAAEWAPFIRIIDVGWERLGEMGYAADEREHDALCTKFRAAVVREAANPMTRPQTRALLGVTECAFASVPETLGALYSFEVQQLATSELAGLREPTRLGDPPRTAKPTGGTGAAQHFRAGRHATRGIATS